MTDPRAPKTFVQRLGFLGGFCLGLGVPVLGVLALLGAKEIADHGAPTRPHYNAMIRTSGASLSRQGGAALVMQDGYDTINQLCVDTCDDLSVDSTESYYGGYKAQLLDAQGRCVACTWTAPVTRRDMIVTSLAAGALTKTVPASSDD